MSTTVINVFMPCLLFSKTVPSFTADNLPEVGVLLLTAIFYQCTAPLGKGLTVVCGLLFALVVRWLTPLPGWRNGVIFAGVFSNWGMSLSDVTDAGDIPLAFVMTLTATAPFTTEDQSLGVAYISVILVWCFLTMFPFGGWMLVKRDFEIPLVRDDVEARGRGTGVSILQKVKGIAMKRGLSSRVVCTNTENSAKLSIRDDNESKRDRDIKISETPSSSQTRQNSTSTMDDLNMIEPIRSHHSHDETELQDLSLAATPSLTHHRNLT